MTVIIVMLVCMIKLIEIHDFIIIILAMGNDNLRWYGTLRAKFQLEDDRFSKLRLVLWHRN